MTDITELAQSLKRRASSANEFGESLYVKADDVIALVEALEKAQTENTAGAAGMAESYETTISMLRSRIAELEESHAQVIQSRDHYKRMSEEGLKQLAESRTVKLPTTRLWAGVAECYEKSDVIAAILSAGMEVSDD